MTDQSKRYRAFISYSQKDKAFARRLHRALEAYRVPLGVVADIEAKSRKLGRFFRDDEEMAAATDLGAALQDAIAAAQSLIVVCSPHAAQSRWVNEEILHFKRTGRADRIFAVIVGGEPNAGDERECFPPALRFELAPDGALTDRPAEPLGVDVRKERFSRTIVRLAAGVIGAPFDDLWKREQRRARARALTTALALGFFALVVGAAVTQNAWRPELETYLRYKRFAHDSATLAAAEAGSTFQDCRPGTRDCPTMSVIPQGAFLMGATSGEFIAMFGDLANHVREAEPGRLVPLPGTELILPIPLREITVARFAVSRHEITIADWQACVAGGGCEGYTPERNGQTDDNTPVTNVSWHDAQNYAAWLSRVTGRRYRLLTEAEWEYAARAQTAADAPHTSFSWGDENPICRTDAPNGAAFGAGQLIAINFDAPEDTTQGCADDRGPRPVGSFPANAFGLHDMHGNVSEWVQDCFLPYDAAKRDSAAAETEDCPFRVHRGGAWDVEPPHLMSGARWQANPRIRSSGLGFRVARDL
ncbi:MAG: hypothetical protein A4S17_12030 [Proteobacteria bacterium HN_bin10]|nr:MAG: hypothetical protein A4S17_12030 [Proteobacteria bacterium HN_bin10]